MNFWDSSALVPLLVNEPDSNRRAMQLNDAPAILVWWGTRLECESALQRRSREGALKREAMRLARDRLKELSDGWNEVEPTRPVRNLAIRLLRTHPLRSADSLQLAAALTARNAGIENMVFISADNRLKEAAEKEGLAVID